MGDLSAEPSMEDILSSIKRIIAEEGDPAPARPRRPARPAARAAEADLDDDGGEADDGADEVLELNDPMPQPIARQPAPRPVEVAPAAKPSAPAVAGPPIVAEPAIAAEPIVSQHAAAAARGSLEALSRLMVKPEPASDGTLESLVREMLRPMLREWLDANLPDLVEAMVTREIAKITGRPE